jgi:hypothetical protein
VLTAGARGALVTVAVGLLTLSFGIDLAVRIWSSEKKGGTLGLRTRAL